MQGVSNPYNNSTITVTLTSNFCTKKVRRQSELTNQLQNVLATISDRKIPHETSTGIIDYYMADIVSSCDEYPGGMIMPGRNFSSDSYMFGHNGQEKDDEITGITGANYTAEFWEYDSRLIWRWNRDKVEKPWESPYACFADNPIWLVDKNGADTSFADNNSRQQFKKTYNEINDRIKINTEDINNLSKRCQESNYENKDIEKQITDLNTERAKLLDIKTTFDEVMDPNTPMFYYHAEPNPNGQIKAGGHNDWDEKNKRFDVMFYSGNQSSIVHETTHGEQYITGKLLISTPRLYDYMDEYEAHNNAQNYNLIIWGKTGKTEIELKTYIETNKKYIKSIQIKKWEQICK